MQWLYLIAAILGTILPLSQFFLFLATYGFDMPSFFRQLFQNHVSASFGMDVIASSLALWLFVFSEGRRRGMKNLWLYVVCKSGDRCVTGSATVLVLSRAHAESGTLKPPHSGTALR